MKNLLKKGLAITLAAAMIFSIMPATADAAKKPKVKKKVTVKVGKTKKIKVKNAKKKAKVKWKSSKKKVVKVVKGTKKYVKIKGRKKGKAKVYTKYKAGKKTYKLSIKVTVKKNTDSTPASTTEPVTPPIITVTDEAIVTGDIIVVTDQAVTATETPVVVTESPAPTATPSPAPKNSDGLVAYGRAAAKTIEADGVAEDEEWEDTIACDLLKNEYSFRGEKKLSAATAKMYWKNDEFDLLVDVKKENVDNNDSVVFYFDEDASAKGNYDENKNAIIVKVPSNGSGIVIKNNDAYTVEAAGASTLLGYTVEIKLTGLKVEKEVGGSVCCDIQINDGKDTKFNYYDSRSNMKYDAETDKWSLSDDAATVDTDTSLMGPVALVEAMKDPLVAFYTYEGEDILYDAEIPEEFESTTLKSKTMSFVPTYYWTDVYENEGYDPIRFENFNIPSYKGNADKVTLTADDVKGYTIWDEDYLYVLFDVTDPDIAPTSEDGYDTDSVEFFLDEDNSRESTYGENADAIQVRVNAIDNFFTANENGTANYPLVAHATKFKYDDDDNVIGYYVELIIQFTKEHQVGEIMGMDLQINDCFTVPGTDGNDDTPDRAGTVTAYDTTNSGFENPSVFGRIKLKPADELFI